MRGRGRGRVSAQQGVPAQPGQGPEVPNGAAQPARVGRGRARAPPSPPQQATPVKVQPPVEQLRRLAVRLPEKERRGTAGTPVQLLCNFYDLVNTSLNDVIVYHYHVTFTEQNLGKRIKSGLLRGWLADTQYLFNGEDALYSKERLPEQPGTVQRRNGDSIQIGLALVGSIDSQNGGVVYENFLNLLFNNTVGWKLGMRRSKRGYINMTERPFRIQAHNLQLQPIYNFTTRRYEGGLKMGVEIGQRVSRTDTVLEMLRRMSNETQMKMKTALVGQVVLTAYNNKTYTVSDIDFDQNPMTMLTFRDGRQTTSVDYYRDKYNITIHDHNQPLLVNRRRRRVPGQGDAVEEFIHLVPEVCHMTGITDNMRKIRSLMTQIAGETNPVPLKRVEDIERFRELLDTPEAKENLETWGVQLGPELEKIPGRVLPRTSLVITGGAEHPVDPTRDFSKITRQKFQVSDPNIGAAYTVVVPEKYRQIGNDFMRTLSQVGLSMGLNISPQGNVILLRNEKAHDYIGGLQEVTDSKISVCILPTNRVDTYNAIKKYCYNDRALPNQVVVASNLTERRAMSVVTKVAIQMSAKIGGEPWTVKIPMRNVMYIGIDTFHKAGFRSSVGGFVASMNSLFTRYYSRVSPHSQGQEIHSQIGPLMTDALKQYFHYNKCYPARIIVFRDGVGNGQIEAVRASELEPMKEAISRAPNGDQIELVFMVIAKRIQQRFLLHEGGRRYNNPTPGTVIDNHITSQDLGLFDFFLVPQCSTQSTATPTHYIGLEKKTSLTVDQLQQISYKLSFAYFNWMGSIRIPAMCQYAHKLSYLVGNHLGGIEPNPDLWDYLYYL